MINQRTKQAIVLAASLSAIVPATGLAGQAVNETVVVNSAARNARGALRATRASNDSTQFIGCAVTTGSSLLVQCNATNAAGAFEFCTSTNADMVAAGRSVGNASSLTFNWDANHVCTSIAVSQFSLNL